MNRTALIAKRFRAVLLDGRLVANTNYKDQLSNVNWKQATTKVANLNTLAALTFHVNYYIKGVLNVFHGGTLDIRDKYSFDMPTIDSQESWENLRNSLFDNTEQFAAAIEAMSDEKLDEVFVDPKYGSYEKNIALMIEHSYYHLGQVVLIKKMVLQKKAA